MTSAFRSLWGCQEIDISEWDISNWAVTTTRYFALEGMLLKKFLLPDGLVVEATQGDGVPSDSRALIEYNGYDIYQNHTFVNCWALSHDSLISILNKLGTVTAARTITLGQTNRLKLTEAEIAIATQKGWTVA